MRQIIMEQLSRLQKEVAMSWAIVVPGKNNMSALMLALKEAKIKEEAVPVQMHHKHAETPHMKYNNETPTVLVHEGQINRTTTLTLSTGEERRRATSEDHDIRCIRRILSSPEETTIDPK